MLDKRISALDDPANHSTDDVLAVDQLNHWAHVVDKKKKGVPQSKKKKISLPEDLKCIKPLPESFHELMELAKNHPSDKLLKPGERWLMFDSGSNVDAADVGKHFPGYAGLVAPTGDARGSAE